MRDAYESAWDANSVRTTLHSYGVGADGRTLEVVSYPGGATQTTTTFADGQMEMTTGTAATTQSSERLSGLSVGMMMEKEYIFSHSGTAPIGSWRTFA